MIFARVARGIGWVASLFQNRLKMPKLEVKLTFQCQIGAIFYENEPKCHCFGQGISESLHDRDAERKQILINRSRR